MAYKDWLYCHNHSRTLTQMYILVLIETHIGAEVMSAFVFPSANIAQALASTFIGSTALQKSPRRFWLHCHDYHCALSLTCQSSPTRPYKSDCNKILPSFWPPLLAQLEQPWSSRDMCINWSKPETSRLELYGHPLNDAWAKGGHSHTHRINS